MSPTYKPYTDVSSLPTNTGGERTILEAHLDSAHGTITDVLERLTETLFTSGGVVVPGTVTNPEGAEVRVQGRLGVTSDRKTLLAVSDAAVDLASVPTGTRCLVVIRAQAGASTDHTFTDPTTGEVITHSLMSAWGLLAVLQGDASTYPPLPADCVPVAEVTKTGAATLTLDAVATDPPTPRYAGGGGGGAGNAYYDLQLGFVGAPAAGAADLILVPRSVIISSADPGDVHVGVNPASTASLDVQVNGASLGTIEISAAGAVTWALSGDVNLSRGDRLALVAPDPADSTLADVIVALRGTAA